MSEWKAKRFWKQATVSDAPAGFAVLLDSRPVRTPAKAPLALPSRALAQAVAAEWDAQDAAIDPASMPLTRAANAAIDKVVPQFDEVAAMLAEYGDADLTCYRADQPEELVARQAAAWDPLLDWAASAFGARLIPVQGVIHAPQPPASLTRLAEQVRAMTAFELTALHDLVTLSGSLVIGLAATRDALPPEELWQRSRIDETWQQEQWGDDDEATRFALDKRRAFLSAWEFYRLIRKKY